MMHSSCTNFFVSSKYCLLSLLIGSFIDLDGTVPGTASNGVEFQVLLKGLARATCEHETFLLVVHS